MEVNLVICTCRANTKHFHSVVAVLLHGRNIPVTFCVSCRWFGSLSVRLKAVAHRLPPKTTGARQCPSLPATCERSVIGVARERLSGPLRTLRGEDHLLPPVRTESTRAVMSPSSVRAPSTRRSWNNGPSWNTAVLYCTQKHFSLRLPLLQSLLFFFLFCVKFFSFFLYDAVWLRMPCRF